ncbi:hypothetical protein D3C72_1032220 [compost metagenome]
MQCGGRLDAEKALGQHFEESRIGRRQSDFGRVGVEHLGAAVLADVATGGTGLGLGVGHVVEVGLDRFGIERCAVGELHIAAQVEGVAQAIWRNLPACRQPGADLAVAVHRHQRIEVLLGNENLRHVAGHMRVQAGGLAVGGIDQSAALLRLGTLRRVLLVRLAAEQGQYGAERDQGEDGCVQGRSCGDWASIGLLQELCRVQEVDFVGVCRG